MALKASEKKVSFVINVWPDRDAIHISSNDVCGFNAAITNIPGSTRYHRTLFALLARVLEENGIGHP